MPRVSAPRAARGTPGRPPSKTARRARRRTNGKNRRARSRRRGASGRTRRNRRPACAARSSGDREPAPGQSRRDRRSPARGPLDRELELDRDARVLLAPQREQGVRQPAAVGAQAVNAGVAGRTKGDQRRDGVPSGPPVMDDDGLPRPAAPAGKPVAGQNRLAVAGEVPERMPSAAGTRAAHAGETRSWPPAGGAEQGALGKTRQKFKCTRHKGHYHEVFQRVSHDLDLVKVRECAVT
jgi:hypothetical protein